ncbi:Formate hydrogenlyase subunit 4 [Carboxydocella sporoproducens DSM 16521]|uniref:Formate hydrogenlyase subunit 4 n=2 Tax=Carboxydocella TaxID=178898 RepID=A0A1T4R5J9_9FIRM|nr:MULTISPECIES: complex I subunit 1 family protein [Carboxydocella]AVX19375.1 carbon monoxide-induced hydrogenase subunit CooK [Carboxydocella thermautotrophica]AVX29788.1 carbon monoxide-induced hydrogenase subunit CooK [Carboxydocella thermautotrophica]SKA11155.1 Formate hydrogenlyase subunit 4 [Carboxydocella sporoproducens DSM 16521]
MTDVVQLIFNLLLFPGGLFAIVVGLFLMGIDRKIVARIQRRVGPPIFQPFIDLVKLARKEVVVPETAHLQAFRLAPLLGFAGMMVAVTLIPIAGVYKGLEFSGDLLVVLYLLALPAIALMVGGSASSSPFGAVGFSREMVMMMSYELPLLVVLVTVALKVGLATGGIATFSLSEIVRYQLENGALLFDYTMLPALLAFLVFIPGNMGVVPFDIPEAETEIVEGPLLEYSGTSLALFKLTSSLKMVVVLGLAIALFFPTPLGENMLLNLLWYILKCLILMVISITVVRASTGRVRIDQAFKFYLKYPTALALISLVLTLLQR